MKNRMLFSIRFFLVMVLASFLAACKVDVLEEKGPRHPNFQITENTHTVLFIHGMYLTPSTWSEWETLFQNLGYNTLSPAWPQHGLSVDEQNSLHPSAELAALTLDDVVDHYRKIIATLDEKPIAIGHSMGGLVTQILLEEGLIAAGIAIHSAPPQGVITAESNFLKANWPHLNPLARLSTPVKLKLSEFQFGFTNDMTAEEQEFAYSQYVVPESRRVGRAPTTSAAAINDTVARAPLLIIAGGNDNTITATLNYRNFKKYKNTPAITDFRQFPERNHWTIKADGWESVADYAHHWIVDTKTPLIE